MDERLDAAAAEAALSAFGFGNRLSRLGAGLGFVGRGSSVERDDTDAKVDVTRHRERNAERCQPVGSGHVVDPERRVTEPLDLRRQSRAPRRGLPQR